MLWSVCPVFHGVNAQQRRNNNETTTATIGGWLSQISLSLDSLKFTRLLQSRAVRALVVGCRVHSGGVHQELWSEVKWRNINKSWLSFGIRIHAVVELFAVDLWYNLTVLLMLFLPGKQATKLIGEREIVDRKKQAKPGPKMKRNKRTRVINTHKASQHETHHQQQVAQWSSFKQLTDKFKRLCGRL